METHDLYGWLANLVLVLHLCFIAFVVLGGLVVLRLPRLAFVHLPAVAWGVLIEFQGWICPLTPLENRLRRMAGQNGYDGDFIVHYITALIYPAGLTRSTQIVLGCLALLLNVGVYLAVWRRRRPKQNSSAARDT